MNARLLACLTFTCISLSLSYSQCLDPDYHNTVAEDMWVSCQGRPSPLDETTSSHWIMYEFDAIYPIEGLTVWNLNHPSNILAGARTIEMQASEDGFNWSIIDTIQLEQGLAEQAYAGEEIPDLEAFNARYVLMTIIDNYGDRCAGIAEVRFTLGQVTTSIAEEYITSQVNIFPNPAHTDITVDVSKLSSELRQMQIIDAAGRVVERRNLSTADTITEIPIETSSYPDGTYTLFLNTDQGVIAKQMIVVHPK